MSRRYKRRRPSLTSEPNKGGAGQAPIAGLARRGSALLLMPSSGSHLATAAPLPVARAPMLLVFYEKAESARRHRAFRCHSISSAVSAPILITLLTHFGSNALRGLVLLSSRAAFAIPLLLGGRRPRAIPAGMVTT